jgi:beta-1,2-mannobiose phosphorylase / 1,2-beta-oligomannan phosphorylase
MRVPPYRLERLGVVMTPDPRDPREAWGVLNPATARRDGEVFLFPRLVAEGNVSRIGRARITFDEAQGPVGVERLGVVLEPEEAWECHAGGGGVEDPRITYLPRLGHWIMTYAAFGPLGPRIGLAASADLEHWQRLGPVSFAYDSHLATDLNLYPNKDALFFPEPVTDPNGALAYAMLHRPMWDLSWVRPGEGEPLPAGLADRRPGIWISFAPAAAVEADLTALTRFEHHRLVALPEHAWEAVKIGGGTPPIRVAEGWLVLHHGVAGKRARGFELQPDARYSAGVLIIDPTDVTRVVARSVEPLLEPELREELIGTVPNVVFPTAIDPLDDSTSPAYDVYYGMADSRIGVARLSRTEPEP